MKRNVQDRRNEGQRNMSQVNFRNVEHYHQSGGESCRRGGVSSGAEGGRGEGSQDVTPLSRQDFRRHHRTNTGEGRR